MHVDSKFTKILAWSLVMHAETQTSPYKQYEWYYSVALTMDEGDDTAQGFQLSAYCYIPPPDSSALHWSLVSTSNIHMNRIARWLERSTLKKEA
jgi:hypothetical protein